MARPYRDDLRRKLLKAMTSAMAVRYAGYASAKRCLKILTILGAMSLRGIIAAMIVEAAKHTAAALGPVRRRLQFRPQS